MNPPIKGKEVSGRTAGSTEGWDYRYDRYRSCPAQCRGKGKRIFWERLRYRRDGNCISSALYSPGNKREAYASGTDKTDAHKSKKAVWSAVKPSWPKRRTGKRKAEFRSLGSGTFLWDRSAEVPVEGSRSCPFEDWNVRGRCLLTVVDGRTIWNAANAGKENR